MYKCVECGHVFSEPRYYTETHGLDTPPYEELTGCPECLGSYDDAEQCVCCGEWFSEDSDDFYSGYCHECALEAYTDELGLGFIKKRRTVTNPFAAPGCKKRQYDLRQEFLEWVGVVDEFSSFELRYSPDKWKFGAYRNELLKEFVTEDFEWWVDYLNEVGTPI